MQLENYVPDDLMPSILGSNDPTFGSCFDGYGYSYDEGDTLSTNTVYPFDVCVMINMI